jgi:hypothetical protein
MGNYAQIRLGLENFSAIDNPSDVRVGSIINNQFCERLREASGVILAQDFISYSGTLICEDFTKIADLGNGFTLVENNK